MKKIVLIVLLLFSSIATATSAEISGKIVDDNNSGLIGATIRLLDTNEKFISGAISSNDCNFTLKSIKNGKYILEVSFIGYETIKKDIEVKSNKNQNLGKLTLKIKEIQGETVIVEAESKMGTMVEDTLQFNAKAFKMPDNAVVEDLLKKIPGIEVKTDGSIKAQGESVQKVLVDGKTFFGDDPKMATKNLPAEVVDKVQIYDKNRDQSEFTGTEDEKKEKAINLVTKEDKRKSIFGKASAGYANEGRYTATVILNIMNDKQRFSIIGLSNNLSIQDFSFSDNIAMATGGTFYSEGFSSGDSPNIISSNRGNKFSNFIFTPSGSISTNHLAGINFSDSFSDWGDLTGSFLFKNSNNSDAQDLYRNYYAIGDSAYSFKQNGSGDSKAYNYVFKTFFSAKIDSTHSIMTTPELTYQTNKMNSTSSTISQYDHNNNKINESNNHYFTNYNGLKFSNNITYVYRFKKKNRNFNTTISNEINTRDGYSLQNAKTIFYSSNTTDSIKQKTNTNNKIFTNRLEAVYVEPISEKSTMQLKYEFSDKRSDINNDALAYNQLSDDYSIIDNLYSSKLNSNFLSHTIGINYLLRISIFTFGSTLRYRISDLNTELILPRVSTINYKMNNLLPSFNFGIKISNTSRLSFSTNTEYSAPSAFQLSDVPDISNPLQIYFGNPNLKPTEFRSLFGSFSSNSEDFTRHFGVFTFISFGENHISNTYFTAMNDTIIEDIKLPAGSQFMRPINMNGFVNVSLNSNYSFPLEFLKLFFSIDGGFNYNKTPSYINSIKNISNNYGYNLQLMTNTTISNDIDISLITGYNYNLTQNSISTAQDYTYKAMKLNLNLKWAIFSGLFITANSLNTFYIENAMNDRKNINILNFSIGYKFLENNAAELELKAFDVLDKNSNIGNNITDRYTEIVTKNILRRYFLLTFTYNLKNFGIE